MGLASTRPSSSSRPHQSPLAKREAEAAASKMPPSMKTRGGRGGASSTRGGGAETTAVTPRGGRLAETPPTRAPTTPRRSAKRGRTLSACTSPRISFLTRHCEFNCYEQDVWTEVAKYLDGSSLVRLASTSRWFHRVIMEDSIWRHAYLRDLQVPPSLRGSSSFKWLHLYASAFDGSHSYTSRQQEKHIDWMRIGAFYFSSPAALLTDVLPLPRRLLVSRLTQDPATAIQTHGISIITNVRPGIWIADLQLVRCPVCNVNTCEGTMQVVDARHSELFLEEGYKNGRWEYEEIGSHRSDKQAAAAVGGIFDFRHINSGCTAGVLDVKSWMAAAGEWQPKVRACLHGVAINTNLKSNEGIHVRFQVMRSGRVDGEVVSIRISQQLL